MTRDAAVVCIALALMGGWYGRHLLQATQDVAAARARLAAALKAVWAARRIALVVGFVIAIAADFWMRHRGP